MPASRALGCPPRRRKRPDRDENGIVVGKPERQVSRASLCQRCASRDGACCGIVKLRRCEFRLRCAAAGQENPAIEQGRRRQAKTASGHYGLGDPSRVRVHDVHRCQRDVAVGSAGNQDASVRQKHRRVVRHVAPRERPRLGRRQAPDRTPRRSSSVHPRRHRPRSAHAHRPAAWRCDPCVTQSSTKTAPARCRSRGRSFGTVHREAIDTDAAGHEDAAVEQSDRRMSTASGVHRPGRTEARTRRKQLRAAKQSIRGAAAGDQHSPVIQQRAGGMCSDGARFTSARPRAALRIAGGRVRINADQRGDDNGQSETKERTHKNAFPA